MIERQISSGLMLMQALYCAEKIVYVGDDVGHCSHSLVLLDLKKISAVYFNCIKLFVYGRNELYLV